MSDGNARSGFILPLRRRSNSAGKTRRRAGLAALASAVAAGLATHAFAASDSWVGSIDGGWNTDNSGSTNWNISGNIPGAAGTTNNTDTATFDGTPDGSPPNSTVTISPNWNIDSISFGTTATTYNIGGTVTAPDAGSLLLTNGGTISDASTDATTINVNAPLVIEGNSYTFASNSTITTDGLGFSNQISGGVAGTATLNLTGSQASTTSHTTNDIFGPIVNGSSSALGLVINIYGGAGSTGQDGTWCLGNSTGADTTPSTYTGPTIIENGALRILSASGISPYTDVILEPASDSATVGTELTVSSAATDVTVNSITVYGGSATAAGATVTSSSSSSTFTVMDATNPGLVAFNGTSTAPSISRTFELEGTGPTGTDGFTFVDSNTTSSVSSGVGFDTGTVQRTFFIGKSTATSGAPGTDFQINEDVTSDGGTNPTTIGNDGIIKTGAGTLKFDDATVSFAGSIDIQQGSFKLLGSGTNQFSNGQYDPVTIEGSTANLNLNGSSTAGNASFGAMSMTAGSITGSANNLLFAPSYTYNIAAGDTFSTGVSLADVSGGEAGGSAVSAVITNGPGTVDLSGIDNSYSGGTTINGGGTLTANGDPSTTLGTGNSTPFGTGSITINGGTLAVDPNLSTGSAAVSWSGATSAGAQFVYAGGAQVNLKAGNASSLTFTVASSLTRTNKGTLVIAASLGTANLGGTEQFVVSGTAPALTHGIVNTSIVGQNDDANDSGDFLTYAGSGFAVATYSGSTNINTAGSAAVYNAGTGSNTNTLSGSAAVYALNAEAQTVDTDGNTLTVGDGVSGHQAGVILNGGSIISSVPGGVLAFSANEGTVYTSKAGTATTPAISANITGTGGLTLFGPGKLYLTGNNSGLSGGVNINQGTVNVSAGNNLGATGNTITFGGGTLQFASSFSSVLSNPIVINAGGGTIDTQLGTDTIGSNITGAGSLTSVGTGSLILTGTNSYTGTTTINAGVLQIGNSTATGTAGAGNIIDNASLVYSLTAPAAVANVISGTGTLTQAGTSTLTVTGANQYGGATNVNSGILMVGSSNPNALGFGAITSGTPATAIVNATGTLDLNGNSLNKSITLNGGTLTNSNNSTAASLSNGISGYVVTAGGSGISAAAAETSGGGGTGATLNVLLGVTNNSVSVSSGGSYTGVPTVTITGGGGTGATATAVLSGGSTGSVTGFIITDPGSGYLTAPTFTLGTATQTSAATLVSNGANFTAVGTQAVTPGSGYTTAPTVNVLTGSGTVITPMLNSIFVQSSSTINGSGAFQLANTVTGEAASGTATLTLDGTALTNSISGVIADGSAGGNLAISKSNTSLWTLSGANTYTGGTTISKGTLQTANNSALGTGPVAVVTPGILDLDGFSPTIGNLSGSGTVDDVSAGGTPTLTINTSTSSTFGGVIQNSSGSVALAVTGTGTQTLSGVNTYTGGTKVSSGHLIISPTATPATTSALPKGALTISGSGKVQLASNVTKGSQSANPPATKPTSSVNITSLSISGTGALDITNNHVIVDYSGLSSDPIIGSIAAWIASGYASGAWTGVGIDSSTAASNHLSYGIGYAASSDPGNPAGLSSGQIEIKYTLLGDTNLDGKVNGTDFTVLATNFNQSGKAWDQGDFNYDGKVNGSDFLLLAANFNQSAGQSAVAADDLAAVDAFGAANGMSMSLTSVPEPASAGMLVMAGLGILSRRRRSSRRSDPRN
jgi:autotransporter-associated beta strand protein